MNRLLGPVIIFCLFAAAVEARASVIIYDTFGPSNTFNNTTGLIVGRNSQGLAIEQGSTFTVPGNVPLKLDSILVAAAYVQGSINRVDFNLRADSTGEPGAILDTLSISNLAGVTGYKLRSTTSSGNLVLQPGQAYWITGNAPSGTQITWMGSLLTGHLENRAVKFGNDPWIVYTENGFVGAVRLTGIPIPEPTTLTLTTLAIYLSTTRRHRKTQRN